MRNLLTLVLILFLLAALLPVVGDFLQSSEAFTTDNLLRTTVVSDSNL